jgi:hypothetical protein
MNRKRHYKGPADTDCTIVSVELRKHIALKFGVIIEKLNDAYTGRQGIQ